MSEGVERSKGRKRIRPEDIAVPPGYKVEVFASGLNAPINLTFDEKGTMYLADAGVTSGKGSVLKYVSGRFEVVATGFNPPLTGITCRGGDIYVAHRGFLTVIKPDGSLEDIITGLPSWGDHHNNRVVFGTDGKMYFGQGTATNSGVVGLDNTWVKDFPYFHDYPGAPIKLTGLNFKTKDILNKRVTAVTGAYSPFGVPTEVGETIKGYMKASGSILRANPDGTNLELVAWGLRNPFRINFDKQNRLFCANHGSDVRGSRPIDNSPDEFQLIEDGVWYGWPDYTGGYPVTMPKFKPDNGPQPEFLITNHPMTPPRPFCNFTPHAAIMGFEFCNDPSFGIVGDAYIAEFGSEAPETTGGKPLPKVGHRVSRIDMKTGKIFTFAINKSGVAASKTGGGGFERPIDVLFDNSGAMYVVDFGVSKSETEPDEYIPESGMIWRIIRVQG